MSTGSLPGAAGAGAGGAGTGPAPFTHAESDRTLVFGEGALAALPEHVAEPYTLLTTPRAAANPLAAGLVARADARVDVPSGLVEDVAAALRTRVRGERLVALGGGRVIDVAKALAAADPPRTVIAVPTTLSGAEMTGVHRHAGGIPADTPRVRPAIVLNDPALSASAPPEQLAASSGNALGHALVAIASARTTPFAAAVAREAVAHIAAAWDAAAGTAPAPGAAPAPGTAPAPGAAPAPGTAPAAGTAPAPGSAPAAPDRAEAALGALLAGWAVDHSGLGLHHVLAQTAVRTAGIPHARANVALLPVTAAALRRRAPAAFAALDRQLGGGQGAVEQLAARVRDAAGPGNAGLGPLATDADLLQRAVEAAAARQSELARIPPPADADEIREIYRAAG